MTNAIQTDLCCLRTRMDALEEQMNASNNSIRYVSESGAILETDDTIVVDSRGGTRSYSLPHTTVVEGRRFTIKRKFNGGQAVTLTSAFADTFDGASTYLLPNDWQSVSFRASNGVWLVTATANS